MSEIFLRPWRRSDAGALYEAVRESLIEVGRFLPWCTAEYGPDQAERWVTSMERAREDGSAFDFAFVDRRDALLGAGGLSAIEPLNRRANLGYWVRTSATGRGVAPASVRALRDWAFANTSLIRLELVISTENARSLRVAEKVGAEREGVLRRRILLFGRAHDAVMFSFTRAP